MSIVLRLSQSQASDQREYESMIRSIARRQTAESLAAREHDAIHFGTVIALGFVHGAFEGADLSEEPLVREQLYLVGAILAKESFHLVFGTIFSAELRASLPVFPGVSFVFFFTPRRRNRGIPYGKILPLQILRVKEGRHIGFPGLRFDGGR